MIRRARAPSLPFLSTYQQNLKRSGLENIEMCSNVPNGTTTESLQSRSIRDNNGKSSEEEERVVHAPLVERDSHTSVHQDNELSHVVTTEHTISNSSQSSLSRHESPKSEEGTPLKSDESAGDETVVDSQQLEARNTMANVTSSSSSSPIRHRGKEKERRAHEKVSWRQSQAGGPTLRDVSPQRQQGEDEEANKSQDESQDLHIKGEKLESLNIASFPTDKLLEMLTALLDKIVRSNDRLMDTGLYQQQQHSGSIGPAESSLRSALSFRGKHVPQISLEQYFQRIQKYCPTSNDVFLSLLVYFDRISRKCNSSSHRPHDNINANTNTNDNSCNDNSNNDSHSNAELQEYNNQQQHPPQQQFVMDSHNIHRLIIAGTTVSTKFFSDFFYSNSRYARVGGISLQELNYLELQFLILCDFELLVSVSELQRYADLLYRFWNNSKPHPSK